MFCVAILYTCHILYAENEVQDIDFGNVNNTMSDAEMKSYLISLR